MKKIIISVLFLFIVLNTLYPQIYLAPEGDDDNPGTILLPYGTFAKAISVITPGDTLDVRGGVYELSSTITISAVQSG
ncbi:MAG: hypothetical protein P8Y60_17175, partial [Calditrichota bacterium]